MRHNCLIVGALCGALALGGCGGGDDDGDEGGPTQSADAPAATSAPEETATATPTATPEGEAVDAVAQQTVKARGARETTVDIAVLGLKVEGKLATLSLSFTMHDPTAAPDESRSLYELNDQQPLYVTLVDPVNLRRYMVVEDSEGQTLQSGAVQTKVPLDASTTAQYTFAAPPPDVTEIDVSVGDWPPFRHVPIER